MNFLSLFEALSNCSNRPNRAFVVKCINTGVYGVINGTYEIKYGELYFTNY